MHKIIFFGCLIMSVTAFANTNFTGVWQLDLDASESIDEILKAQGKSRIERMVARSMMVTQSIEQQGNEIFIHIKSKAMDNTQAFILNGQWKTIQTPNMGMINVKSFFSKNFSKIVTVMKITAKGEPALMTVYRSLTDNTQTMILKIHLKLSNGNTHFVKRVFRRIE